MNRPDGAENGGMVSGGALKRACQIRAEDGRFAGVSPFGALSSLLGIPAMVL
jgi:hypothetical protein